MFAVVIKNLEMLRLPWVGLKYNQVYPYKKEPEGNFMTQKRRGNVTWKQKLE